MRRIYILPNLFTAGSLFCGLLSVYEVLEVLSGSDAADLEHACHLVFIAGILDVFDGLIARLTKSTSLFGLNFDSLSDCVAFGAAPSMIVYTAIFPNYPLLAKGTCGLFAICAAMRLARFNVQATREEKRSFLGLPTPGAACAAVSAFWVLSVRSDLGGLIHPEKVLPPIMVLLAYLMVSKIPYFGLKSVQLVASQRFESLVSVVVVLALLVTLKEHIDLVMFFIFGAYVLSGPAMMLSRKPQAAVAKASAPASGPIRPGSRDPLG